MKEKEEEEEERTPFRHPGKRERPSESNSTLL